MIALVRGILFLKPKRQTFKSCCYLLYFTQFLCEGLSSILKTCSNQKYFLLADDIIILSYQEIVQDLSYQEIVLDSQGEIPFFSNHGIDMLHCSLFIILLLPLLYSLDPEKSPWRLYCTCLDILMMVIFLYCFIFFVCFSYLSEGHLIRASSVYDCSR